MHAAPLPDSPQALKALAVSLLEGIAQRDAQIAERDQRIDVRTQELVEATTLIEKLKFQLLCFQRARYGKKSEAIGADQIALWEAELDADIEALQGRLDKLQASLGAKKSAYRETPKRQLLPDTLPRIEQHLEPQNTVCDCGAAMTRIGEDVAETLQMIPAKFYVQRRIRGKWACRCCQKLVMAPVPPAPIDKGLAGASVLAQVIVSKYQDHLPLHRQEGIYARMGVTIARSTMAGWIGHQQVSLEPLTDLLASRVIEHSGLQADETPVRVLDPGSGKTATGYLWAYRTLPSAPIQAVVFDFAMNRRAEHPNRMLAGFAGTLQVDGYAGYNDILARATVIEAGCLAHARRKYVEVYEATKSPVAKEAITRIAALYEIEAEIRGADAPERLAQRAARAAPLLGALHDWLLATHAKAPPRGALAKAIRYTLNRWPALVRYVEDPRLPPDTNAVENCIRGIALGRKNWLFAGSEAGGKRAAMMYSLIETCKLNGIEPLHYLRDVIERMPSARMRDLEAMLPWNWKPPNGPI